MELFVKIGADQQNLQQTVDRIRQQFKTMNMSVPVGWDSAGAGASWNRAAKSAGAVPEDDRFVGKLIGKLTGFSAAGGGMFALAHMAQQALEKFVDWASNKLGSSFWNKVYGVDEDQVKRTEDAHERISKSARGMRKEEKRYKDALEKSVFENATDQGKLIILQGKLKEAQKQIATARSDIGAAEDRTKTAKGYLGAPLTIEQKQKLLADEADARAQLARAKTLALNIEDQIKKQTNEIVSGKDAAAAKEKLKKQAEMEGNLGGRASFDADALTRVGLFAGSSLNMNADFSIQREQLQTLLRIEANQGRGEGFL